MPVSYTPRDGTPGRLDVHWGTDIQNKPLLPSDDLIEQWLVSLIAVEVVQEVAHESFRFRTMPAGRVR